MRVARTIGLSLGLAGLLGGVFTAGQVFGRQTRPDPFIDAVQNGNTVRAISLRDQGADPNAIGEWWDEDGCGPWKEPVLSFAAGHLGDPKLVKALLRKGARVNAHDETGRTALIKAASWDQTRVIRVLVASGADVNAQSETGETPLQLVKVFKDAKAIRILKHYGARR